MKVAQREIQNTTEELHPVSHLDKEKESKYCHPGQIYTAECVQPTLRSYHAGILTGTRSSLCACGPNEIIFGTEAAEEAEHHNMLEVRCDERREQEGPAGPNLANIRYRCDRRPAAQILGAHYQRKQSFSHENPAIISS